ncbi:MAG: hypothetical protein GTO55_08805 [Armatimonadetes bacterium]|nr:hypothetical protein [Armatimonadota bacterium]NIM24346.1 hypothetical protein [Armatimonadota bacterium]NIM68215.1 hypothetical protein [Armatimonadota bacterium]NIM75116.1 hypothetical protein [Armatimonadota bacterium]NIN06420.1 hypothetical protein [Armatimonadota bacterium]
MPVRGVETHVPIEQVPEVEREPESAEHEKRGERTRRVSRKQPDSHAHREGTDTWCGHGESEKKNREQEEKSKEASLPETVRQRQEKSLDYKA